MSKNKKMGMCAECGAPCNRYSKLCRECWMSEDGENRKRMTCDVCKVSGGMQEDGSCKICAMKEKVIPQLEEELRRSATQTCCVCGFKSRYFKTFSRRENIAPSNEKERWVTTSNSICRSCVRQGKEEFARKDFNQHSTKQLNPVTLDEIKALRLRGYGDEATRALKTFHKSVREEKSQILKEMNEQDRKIKKNFAVKYNLCTQCMNEKPIDNFKLCVKCRKTYYDSKQREKILRKFQRGAKDGKGKTKESKASKAKASKESKRTKTSNVSRAKRKGKN